MTPERFRQVRNVFEAALEKAPAERAVFLDEAARSDSDLHAQVERMLDAHESTVTFLDGALAAPAELRTDPRRLEGRRLGNYEILREIGRGGMGTVYLARRADGLFEQQVAIKVVTPESAGHEVIERFDQERAILASLQHPGIARLYDGGSTEEGWPYFVMEYVEGKPIDQWCDERKLNTSERIRLFRAVCGAVQFALQHRVIHRDLKPGNILVTEEGAVKLLDFGIAKLVGVDADQKKTSLATRTGTRLMTPEYASPEQFRAEAVTPLSDLYSLGVILYELLTGRRPYRLKSRIFHEIVRVVCEEPPARPSSVVTEVEERPGEAGKTITIAPGAFSRSREGTPSDLKRRLSGDLDGILLKALEKDPRRRYRSLDQFSMDLDRHLRGEPVSAAKTGRFPELVRFASKYRLGILLAFALLLAFIIGGIRIDWRAIALVAGAAAALGLWHLATDRELGARISETAFGDAPVLVLSYGVGAGVLCVYFFSSWMRRESYWVLIGVALLESLFFVALFCKWASRARWAGSLICSIRTKDPPFWKFVLIVGAESLALIKTLQLLNSLTHHIRDYDAFLYQRVALSAYQNAAVLVMFVVLGLYQVIVMPYLEVRDRGLLHGGRLFSWLNIESYEWESAEPGEFGLLSVRPQAKMVLCLHVSRLFSILPSPRISVPRRHQEELEAILKRHLSEWPQS
jgi:serine/threonine protein kinase